MDRRQIELFEVDRRLGGGETGGGLLLADTQAVIQDYGEILHKMRHALSQHLVDVIAVDLRLREAKAELDRETIDGMLNHSMHLASDLDQVLLKLGRFIQQRTERTSAND